MKFNEADIHIRLFVGVASERRTLNSPMAFRHHLLVVLDHLDGV